MKLEVWWTKIGQTFLDARPCFKALRLKKMPDLWHFSCGRFFFVLKRGQFEDMLRHNSWGKFGGNRGWI